MLFYVHSKLFQKNFEYVLYNTDTLQQINSALTAAAVPGMPAMVKLINKWSETRPVYWSMTKAANRNESFRGYLYPGIFGGAVNKWGLQEAVDLFDVNVNGHPDSVKVLHKEFMLGNMKEFDSVEPDLIRQKQLKI